MRSRSGRVLRHRAMPHRPRWIVPACVALLGLACRHERASADVATTPADAAVARPV
ncbi:MAG: hypothetical protein JWM10_4127, partial [Myxococcaceae bacterium]|nr:hypothetical protein [Myxococcaceae bacterium]